MRMQYSGWAAGAMSNDRSMREESGTGVGGDYDPGAMAQALRLARQSVLKGDGGPFGCVIMRGDEVVGTGTNTVTRNDDPTAHAEIVAIRQACARLGTYQLTGCTVYASCEPCPMCLGAIYWARPDAVYFAATREDAAAAGFDDESIYAELMLPPTERTIRMRRVESEGAAEPFRLWNENDERIPY